MKVSQRAQPPSPRRRALLAGAFFGAAALATRAGATSGSTTTVSPSSPPARAPVNTSAPDAGMAASHAWLPQSRRVGHGTLRALGFAVYDAALFALPDFDGQSYAEHPLVLEIRYRRALAGADIAEFSLKEMRRAGELDDATAERWLQFMRRAFPDVRAGDRLTGQWLPASATSRFAANDGAAVSLVDATFGPRFFGIWLATRTPRPDMREQLLGLRRPA